MIEINLIPQKLKKQKKIQVAIALGIFAAVCVAAALVGMLALQYKHMAEIDSQIKKVDAESASLKDKIEEVRKFNALEDGFSKKKAIVDKLLKEQSFWPELMDSLGELMLPDMWLLSIDQSKEKEDSVMITITGRALSKVVVADFIKRLEASPRITELTTAKIGEDNAGGTTATSFQISFNYKRQV
jgi:Tfp pilus assembly protein PilN